MLVHYMLDTAFPHLWLTVLFFTFLHASGASGKRGITATQLYTVVVKIT